MYGARVFCLIKIKSLLLPPFTSGWNTGFSRLFLRATISFPGCTSQPEAYMTQSYFIGRICCKIRSFTGGKKKILFHFTVGQLSCLCFPSIFSAFHSFLLCHCWQPCSGPGEAFLHQQSAVVYGTRNDEIPSVSQQIPQEAANQTTFN